MSKTLWSQVMAAVIASFFTHSFSVRLGNGTLSATVGGKPVTLTANAIIAAAMLAFAGEQASVECGSVTVTFTPNTSVTSA